MRHHLEIAKNELEALGPETDHDRSIRPTAILILPSGEEKELPFDWGDAPEVKKIKLFAIALTARLENATALMYRIATSSIDASKIGREELHLDVDHIDDPQKLRYFEERVQRWVKQKTGDGRFGHLPDEYRIDCLMIGAMGPQIKQTAIGCKYRWVTDHYEYSEWPMHGPHAQWLNRMITEWWDDDSDRPIQ